MSTTVDNRVVEMQFDNKHFETNVSTTLSTLDKLKQKLNLTGATKGLENVDAAARKVDMGYLGSAVETVQAKFSALQVMGVTALANITNSAVNAGKRMVSALTIDPIKTGFSEYETQINAVQTILANTESKGTTLKDVTGALDELNTYADQTIYNFTEMTRNIGTFTAAGVDLDKSVTSIKGIANLAAVSGSTSQQASTAMYQLSQALAAGKVSLMDWNSVVNAGMGGEVFQNALKRTARQLGTGVDEAIEKYGTFRESLTQGNWLTTEVLTETLTQLSGAYSEADLIAQGYSKEQAQEIAKLADTAVNAATKVKTFTQLWDTLKESAQSGWTQTWELIVGDFEEAKELLTKISDVIGGFINQTSEARNKVLEDWRKERFDEFGNKIGDDGRTVMIEGLTNAFKGLLSVLKPIKEAFSEVFDPITGDQLYNLTTAFKDFTAKMTVSDETADKIKRTFEGVFSIVELFGKAIKSVFGIASPGLSIIGSLVDIVLDFTAALGDMFVAINEGAGTGDFFSGLSNGLVSAFTFIDDILHSVTGGMDNVGDVFSKIGEFISNVAGKIADALGKVFDFIHENVSAGDIFAGLAGGGLFLLLKNLGGFIGKFGDMMDGGLLGLIFGGKGDKGDDEGMLDRFKGVLDGVQESLSAFTSGIKVASLATIAIAIGVLSASLTSISKLDPGDIALSLGAIAAMLVMLNLSFKSITKSLDLFGGAGIVKAGVSLILMATAIKIFASAIEDIAAISFGDVVKGLFTLGTSLAILSLSLKAITKSGGSLKAAAAMVVLAQACKMLGDALAKFGELTWKEIAKGLTAMGGALAELTAVMAVMDKVGGLKSLAGATSIFIVAQSLDDIADALKSVGSLSWEQIGKGLTGIGGVMAELTVALGVLGKVSGFSSVFGATAILIAAQALDDIGAALKDMGSMSWKEIGKGLSAMGGALAELSTAVGVLGKITGLSGIAGAAAVLIAAQSLGDIADALKDFGSMAWDEIGRGLAAMGGALAELATATGLLGGLTGFSGILGGGALVIAVQSLSDLADGLKKFGDMAWDEIGRGLVGMGGALTEVAVITGVLGTLAGLPALLGGGAMLIAVQSLGDLADAFKKFGEMSWDEIKAGLAAMGGALGELALGGFLNTFAVFGAGAISEMAEPLGTLADSVKKWTGVTIPEGLGMRLGMLASGIGAFNFAGWGAVAIAAVAEPLGTLATSVTKWTGITVPENLGANLSELADGVQSWSFAFMGGWSIGTAAESLGVLAESIGKWSGVTVPEGMQSKLESLAEGVKAWSWAFMGGWSIDAAAEPIKELADAVKAWNGVALPEGIQGKLEGLAEGVKAWSWAFVGGWSIDAAAKPLKTLAGSIKEWNGVTIPDGLGGKLESLADGIKTFEGVSGKDLTNVCDGIRSIGTAATDISGIDFGGIASELSGFADSIDQIDISADTFTNLGQNIVSGIVDAISKGVQKVQDSGKTIVGSFAEGISKNKTAPVKNMTAIVQAAAKASSGNTNAFRLAGYNCAIGFANGISSGSYAATIRARAMANAAANAAKRALDEHSPSKVFYGIGEFAGIGFVNALSDYADKSYEAGSDIAASAKNGLGNAIGKIADVFNSDIDSQPTIRPVLDLSNIKSGAGTINSMLGGNVLATVGGINSAMNRRNQNGVNDDVVSAINKLRKDVGAMERPSYNVGGITYDEGSAVANAVAQLVHAVRVERRV